MPEFTRRKFIELTVLSSAIGTGLVSAGCQGGRDEITGTYGGTDTHGVPYVNQPPGLQDGVPQYFATTCTMCPAGCGLMLRTMAGRAIKVEGNPIHPVNMGKTCALGQASLQQLYNPNRIRQPFQRNRANQEKNSVSWEIALRELRQQLAKAIGQTAILADAATIGRSPTQQKMISDFGKLIGGEIFYYQQLDDSAWRKACQVVYGRDQIPTYKINEADLIIAVGANFLEAWPSPVYYGRLYGQFRQSNSKRRSQSGHFVYIGPRMSMTAANADEWFACLPGTETTVVLGLLSLIGGSGIPVGQASSQSGITVDQFIRLAKRIKAASKGTVAIGGDGLLNQADPVAAFLTVESLNALINSDCVGFGQSALPMLTSLNSNESIQSLVSSLNNGAISTLVILGNSNPVGSLSQSLGLKTAISKAKFSVALASFDDDTTVLSDLFLPTRTFIEDSFDHSPLVIPSDTTMVSLGQEIIDPKFILTKSASNDQLEQWMDTRPLQSVFASLLPNHFTDYHSTNLKQLSARLNEEPATLQSRGGFWKTDFGSPLRTNLVAHLPLPTPNQFTSLEDRFVLEVYPQIYWHDGRYTNLPWLQEIPDPMSSVVWNIWAEINLQVAINVGIRTGDTVRLTSESGSIELPAVPSNGVHPKLIAIPRRQGQSEKSDTTFLINQNGLTTVTLRKIRSAEPGFSEELNTLVTVQDMPNGQEPDAVKNLIHTTARELSEIK